uniref:Uncharacterized protein n=1 Tax=Biomphalaria glabrata TaxID=6526 RepID=A0A2C9LX35_BIOGL
MSVIYKVFPNIVLGRPLTEPSPATVQPSAPAEDYVYSTVNKQRLYTDTSYSATNTEDSGQRSQQKIKPSLPYEEEPDVMSESSLMQSTQETSPDTELYPTSKLNMYNRPFKLNAMILRSPDMYPNNLLKHVAADNSIAMKKHVAADNSIAMKKHVAADNSIAMKKHVAADNSVAMKKQLAAQIVYCNE